MRQQMDKLGQILQRPAEADGGDLHARTSSCATACSAAIPTWGRTIRIGRQPMDERRHAAGSAAGPARPAEGRTSTPTR